MKEGMCDVQDWKDPMKIYVGACVMSFLMKCQRVVNLN